MIPWNLYNLTPRDQASPNIRPYYSQTTNNVVAGTIQDNVLHTIPDEYVLLLTSVSVGQDSPGNNPEYVRFFVQEPGHVHYDVIKWWNPGIPNTVAPFVAAMSETWSGNPMMLCHPRDTITTSARKLATGTAWVAYHAVAGVLIPRGTIDAN